MVSSYLGRLHAPGSCRFLEVHFQPISTGGRNISGRAKKSPNKVFFRKEIRSLIPLPLRAVQAESGRILFSSHHISGRLGTFHVMEMSVPCRPWTVAPLRVNGIVASLHDGRHFVQKLHGGKVAAESICW